MKKSRPEILEHLVATIREVKSALPAETTISPESHLMDDLGLDSLEYATVLLSSERWLGVRIAEQGVDWSALSTIDSLAAFLEGQQG